MKLKTFMTMSVALICAGSGAYLAHTLKSKSDINNVKSELMSEKQKANELQRQMPAKESLHLATAMENYGYKNVVALAMNGLNECPSSEHVKKRIRCSKLEEAAVMYAAINLTKLGQNGKSIHEVVYSKASKNAYMFSWVPDPSLDDKSEAFNDSLIMAGHILGGGSKYEKADHKQFYYCNNDYTSGGVRKSGCANWHFVSPNLVELGRMHININDVRGDFVRDSELSKHHFFTLTKAYLKNSGVNHEILF